MTAADELLNFWFAPATKPFWFASTPAFDDQLRTKFGHLLDTSADLGWPDTAQGLLAQIILFDQLPRNLFRGSATAFAFDDRASALTGRLIDRGLDQTLDDDARLFAYMPLQHAEDLAAQNRSIQLYAQLSDPNPLAFAYQHRDIIVRFGRLPHRNAVLGRQSTRAELAYLAGELPDFTK